MKPDHFYYGDEWNRFNFLPMFSFTLAHHVKCGDCPLAAYMHPLVQDACNENSYSKLCTVQVIKAGLLKLETVFFDQGGCGRRPDDYQRAKKMFVKRIYKGLCEK